jgi:uncharacterized damage-inducible protein DinB
MSTDHYRLLFEYDAWANQRVLEEAESVPEGDYYAAAPGLSFGSLHATLVHILVAEVVWLARWHGGRPPEALRDARQADRLARDEVPTFARLQALWRQHEASLASFIAELSDEAVEAVLSYEDQYGHAWTQPLWQLMTHLLNHGTQFRAEAAVRLTQLGCSPGDLDLIVWLRALGSKNEKKFDLFTNYGLQGVVIRPGKC